MVINIEVKILARRRSRKKSKRNDSNNILTIALVVGAVLLFSGQLTGASITGAQVGDTTDTTNRPWSRFLSAFRPAPPQPTFTEPIAPVPPTTQQPSGDVGINIPDSTAKYPVPSGGEIVTGELSEDQVEMIQTASLLEYQASTLRGGKTTGSWGCSCVCNALGDKHAWGRACIADCPAPSGGSGGGPGGGQSSICLTHCKTLCGGATVAAAQCKEEC